MDTGKISEKKLAHYGLQQNIRKKAGSLWKKTSWLTMDPGKISENKLANYGPQQNIRKQAG